MPVITRHTLAGRDLVIETQVPCFCTIGHEDGTVTVQQTPVYRVLAGHCFLVLHDAVDDLNSSSIYSAGAGQLAPMTGPEIDAFAWRIAAANRLIAETFHEVTDGILILPAACKQQNANATCRRWDGNRTIHKVLPNGKNLWRLVENDQPTSSIFWSNGNMLRVLYPTNERLRPLGNNFHESRPGMVVIMNDK